MNRMPEFTDIEKYLIEHLKTDEATLFNNSYMWTYLVCATALSGFAIQVQSFTMIATAFFLVVGFRIHEERIQKKWQPCWKSIILKRQLTQVQTDRKGKSHERR